MPNYLCKHDEFREARIYASEKYLIADYAVTINNNGIKEKSFN